MVKLTIGGQPVTGTDGKTLLFEDEAAAHQYAKEHIQPDRSKLLRGKTRNLRAAGKLPTVSIDPA